MLYCCKNNSPAHALNDNNKLSEYIFVEKRCKIVESKAVLFSASLVLVAIAAAIFFHHLGE